MKPIVAIVGRPNVGKSTLFNRLAGQRLAIVHDEPGVTRDRHYADAELEGREMVLIDTGGFDPETEDPIGRGIAAQVEIAVDEADAVVCVLDAVTGPTQADRDAVRLLRQSGKSVIWAANKADNPERELVAAELYALGVEPIIPVSALHGRGFAELAHSLVRALPEAEPQPPSAAEGLPRVALVGRPNAGKSSLLNRLAHGERALVDERPGTTRDPIDVRIEIAGTPIVLVDTAGIRRRSRVERGIEAAAVMRSLRAMERAEIVVLLCDASQGVTEQDARLLGLIAERGRAVIVGLNKMDLLPRKSQKKTTEDAREVLAFARWAPIVALSAVKGWGIGELGKLIVAASAEFRKRVATSALNRFFEQVLERQQPPTRGGRAPRVYYVTQAEVAPPLFVVMCSHPEAIADSYKRFVMNQIRSAFGFEAIPLRIAWRARSRHGGVERSRGRGA